MNHDADDLADDMEEDGREGGDNLPLSLVNFQPAAGGNNPQRGDGEPPSLPNALERLRQLGFETFCASVETNLLPYLETWMASNRPDQRPTPSEVLRQAFHQVGLLDADGRVSLPPDGLQHGRKVMTDLREAQRKLLEGARWAMELYKDARHDEAETCLSLVKLHAVETVRVIDHALVMLQSTTLLLQSRSNGWHKIEDLGDAKFYREVIEIHPLVQQDVGKDQRVKLVLHLLRQFQLQGFRKKPDSDVLYHKVTFSHPETGEHVFTYAYAPLEDRMESLIYDMIIKEERADLWPAVLHGGIVRDLVTYLKKCKDHELPDVRQKPRMYSFDDGVYDLETDRFAYYENVEEVFPELGQGWSTYMYLRGKRFSPVYFSDGDMDQDHDPWDAIRQHLPEDAWIPEVRREGVLSVLEIPLPSIMKIFDDQHWSWHTKLLFAACVGRLFYPVGFLDKCQYWPIIRGPAGNGKSTLIELIRLFFLFLDVAVLGADQEAVFSRHDFPSKRVIIAPEVRGDNFGCSVASFLAMVGGDPMSFPVKYGEPKVVENFPVQGIMAANELPKAYLNDSKGAVARRLLVFPLPESIHPRDPTLKTKIFSQELPGFLRFCGVLYQMLPKDVDIMSGFPLTQEMEMARAELQRASNPMLDFLWEETFVTRGPELSVLMSDLKEAFGIFMTQHRNIVGRPPAWTEELYDYPFRLLRLRVEEEDGELYAKGCALRQGVLQRE